MRSRRVSLPANLVQTNYHSIVGGGAVGASVAAKNRMSVASVASFESLPEELFDEAGDYAPPEQTIVVESRPRPRLSRRSASPAAPSARLSTGGQQRHSLPTPPAAYNGAYRSFVVPSATAGRTNPLGRSPSFNRDQVEL